MKTHCRQCVCGHCDCLVISLIFRLTTFDVIIRRQKSSKSANRVFYISLNKGYFGKAIFSRLFSARYHLLKKKKKKKKYWAYVDVVLIITLSILATCLVSSNCSVTHVRWWEGTYFLSAVSMTARIFWIDWDINEKRSADVVTTLAQCFALITFEVLNQIPPNLLGSCRSSSRWYLQNYIKNSWELTSELTSKWVYILKYSTNFTLISLITFEVLAQTLQNSQGSGHNTIRWCLQNYMEDGWELTSELTSK